MRILKLLNLNFFLLLLLFYSGTVQSQYSSLSIKIKTEKDTFKEGEIIPVTFTIINKDNKPVSIGYNCSLEDDLTFFIKVLNKNDSRIYKREESFAYDCACDPQIFGKNDPYSSLSVLLLSGLNNLNGKESLPTGNYIIFIEDTSRGIHSDTASFNVAAQDDTDYTELNKIITMESSETKFKLLRKFLYSKRKYSDVALSGLLSFINNYKKNTDMLEDDLNTYFAINPNAWSTDKYLLTGAYIYKKIEGDYELYNFLRRIYSTFPDTRVSSLAEKIIKDEKFPNYVY